MIVKQNLFALVHEKKGNLMLSLSMLSFGLFCVIDLIFFYKTIVKPLSSKQLIRGYIPFLMMLYGPVSVLYYLTRELCFYEWLHKRIHHYNILFEHLAIDYEDPCY